MNKAKVLIRLAVSGAIALAAVAMLGAPAHAQEDVTAKLQALIGELSAEQQASLYLLLKQLKGGGGSVAGGETSEASAQAPEEAAKAVVSGFFEAAAAEDIEKMMGFFSENFDHYEYGDKQGVKDFLTQAIDMGYMQGIESNMDDAEFEVQGDEMTIYPVDVSGAFGTITFEYVLKKEGDAWKIIGFDAAGL